MFIGFKCRVWVSGFCVVQGLRFEGLGGLGLAARVGWFRV